MMSRTVEEFFEQPRWIRDRWNNVLEVIKRMRAGVSLRVAAREVGISPGTVIRLGGSALRRLPNGEYIARLTDHLLRVVYVVTPDGVHEIATRNFRTASLIGEHSNAVHRYLTYGDASKLRRFRGHSVTDADGVRHFLLKDLDELDRLGRRGVLSFEDMYAR
jgi:hypothetical protein